MHSSAVTFEKRAQTPEAIERLSLEATVLTSVAHPNVVELLAITITGDKACLSQAKIEGTSLAEADLTLSEYGRVVMSAAATLAHVHSQGVSHNRIDANHIVVRSDKSAVLCGFGGATFTHDDFAFEQDVVALAMLLRNFVETRHDQLRARINDDSANDNKLVTNLRSCVEAAIEGDIAARILAERLRSALDTNELTVTSERRHLTISGKIGVVATLTLLALIAGWLSIFRGGIKRAEANTATTVVAKSCHSVNPPAHPVDIDGDGCPNAVVYGDGVVTVDDQRYAVGDPGDELLAGDWQGDGKSTLALLRLSTGEIFIFGSWPAPGKTITPKPLSTVPGADDIAVNHSGNRDLLIIDTPNERFSVDPISGTTTSMKQ